MPVKKNCFRNAQIQATVAAQRNAAIVYRRLLAERARAQAAAAGYDHSFPYAKPKQEEPKEEEKLYDTWKYVDPDPDNDPDTRSYLLISRKGLELRVYLEQLPGCCGISILSNPTWRVKDTHWYEYPEEKKSKDKECLRKAVAVVLLEILTQAKSNTNSAWNLRVGRFIATGNGTSVMDEICVDGEWAVEPKKTLNPKTNKIIRMYSLELPEMVRE